MRRRPPPIPRRRRQRGAALLTAMIIVTLVATLAAAMVWQQWRAVQVETAERARVQAAWILSGALDFARLIIKETVKDTRPTTLTDPWATPLAEARLSTFLAVDKSNADDGPEAFLSGSITDAQGRFNLNNLGADVPGKPPLELEALERLCGIAGVGSGVAARIANGLRDAGVRPGDAAAAAAAPLRPEWFDQLAWFGIDADTLQRLRPHLVLLPAGTRLNVNTASREVLAAVTGLDMATVERLVLVRQRTPFTDMEAFKKQAPALAPELLVKLDTRSNFFDVRGRLRLVDRVLVEHSLVQRTPTTGVVTVLQRERIAGIESAGP